MFSRHQPASTSVRPPPGQSVSSGGRLDRSERSRAPRWFVWLGIVALAAYTLFLALNSAAVAAGPDSSGYFNSARLLAEGKFRTPLRVPAEFGSQAEVNPAHFSPLGFKLFPHHPALVPSYPTGLPLHFAVAGKMLGWEVGPFIVQLLAAIGAVLLCYLVARELGAGFLLAGAGAAMLAVFPVFIFTSIQTLSDTLATTWALATFFCALRTRVHAGWSAACGAALAMAVLVRPTNVLIAPALLVLLGGNARHLAGFVAGGLPGAVWLALYNHYLYGGVLQSGYGSVFEAFAVHYGMPTAIHFTKWLLLFLPTPVLVLPVIALVRRETRRRDVIALALAFAAITGVYLFYDVSHDVWWCLRFILPGVAALILASLVGAEAMTRWRARLPSVLAVGLIIWALGSSWFWVRKLHVLYVPKYERAYGEAATLVRDRLPENALIVCSVLTGTLYYYTDFPTLVYDSLKPEEFARYAALARGAGRPIYAAIFNIEEEEALRTRCPGNWKRLASVDNIGLWQLQ